jgi:hypothetical protein
MAGRQQGGKAVRQAEQDSREAQQCSSEMNNLG